jgi:N-acetylneuraminic acid mutarotase
MHHIPSPVFEYTEYTKDPTAVLLRDDSHPMLSYAVLDQLRRRSQFCDVELKMKGNVRLQAHKVILASSSPYFLKQFTTSSSALKKFELTLSDPLLDVNAVELLISFIYTSVLRITEGNAHSVCLGARVLQLERVERACCKFMAKNLNQRNCIESLNFSFEHGYPQLLKKSQAYIAEHITEVAANPAFCTLFPSELSGIFESESLTIPSEEALIDLLITWMKHEPESRQKELHHLVSAAKLQGTLETSKKNLLNVISHPPVEDSTMIIQKLREISEKPKPKKAVTPPVNTTSSNPNPTYTNAAQMLYAAGGITSSSATSAVEKYNIRNGTWTRSTSMPRKKSHFALVTTGDALYSIGGYDGSKRLTSIDIFHPEGESWSEGPSMFTAKSDFGAVWDGKRSIYLIGGYTAESQDVAAVEILDTQTRMWRKGPKLQQKRSYVQSAILDNAIYAVGGAVGNTRLASVEMLQLVNKGEKHHQQHSSWVYVANLNVARSRPGVAALNGKLYAVGGYNGSEHLSSVECYDPSLDRWQLIEPMASPRNSPAVAVQRGERLYVAGGHDGKKVLNSVEVYSLREKSWKEAPPMDTARCDFALATIIVTGIESFGTWM